jgi:hypothetical protein
VLFQPHSSPGVYARAFLEGRPYRERPLALSTGAHRSCAWRTWTVQLPAPVPDAGLLAVSDGLHGHRPDQLDLSRAVNALSHRSAAARLRRPTRLGACSATARWTSPNR